jgi:Delta14-sterol reductase
MGLVAGLVLRFGPESFTFLYERFVGFITASLIMAVAQGLYCYFTSFVPSKLLALGGNSGNPVYDVRHNPLYITLSTNLAYLVFYW